MPENSGLQQVEATLRRRLSSKWTIEVSDSTGVVEAQYVWDDGTVDEIFTVAEGMARGYRRGPKGITVDKVEGELDQVITVVDGWPGPTKASEHPMT